jgi:hypothetical protein
MFIPLCYKQTKQTKQTPWPLVRERTIPTDQPPPLCYSFTKSSLGGRLITQMKVERLRSSMLAQQIISVLICVVGLNHQIYNVGKIYKHVKKINIK